MQSRGSWLCEPRQPLDATFARPWSTPCSNGLGVGRTFHRFGALVPPEHFVMLENPTPWSASGCRNMVDDFARVGPVFSYGAVGASSLQPQEAYAGYGYADRTHPNGQESWAGGSEQQNVQVTTSHCAFAPMLRHGPPENLHVPTRAMQDYTDEQREKRKARKGRGGLKMALAILRNEACESPSSPSALAWVLRSLKPLPPGELNAGSIGKLRKRDQVMQQLQMEARNATTHLCPSTQVTNSASSGDTASRAFDLRAVPDREFPSGLARDEPHAEYMWKAVQEWLYEEDECPSADPYAEATEDGHMEPTFRTDENAALSPEDPMPSLVCAGSSFAREGHKSLGLAHRFIFLFGELCEGWDDIDWLVAHTRRRFGAELPVESVQS